jgi:AraC-like DNA-binding protein
MDVVAPGRGHRLEQFKVAHVGGLRVLGSRVPWRPGVQPCVAQRTARHIALADPEWYRIDIPLTGRLVVDQDGRHAVLGTRDFSVIDQSRPSSVTMPAQRFATVVVPKPLLPLPGKDVVRLTATSISGRDGVGKLVTSVVVQMLQLDPVRPADGVRLGSALVDLLTVAVGARVGLAASPATVQRTLLSAIHAFIEERLGDPELAPATIAAAHHISDRYLYRLFEPEGDGVAGWIRRRRLERCRRDLLDPVLLHHPVGAIGARWGLGSPAQFSRTFRSVYGVPPGEYRRAHSAGEA